MKTLFVTGAEGFTGKHIVEYLRRRGYDVVGGVRNRARKLAFERQYGRALVCDVSDAITVARAIASVKPEGVIHLAGVSKPHVANEEPLAAYQSIVTGWANVLDAVRRIVPRARVLMTSACDVYGQADGDLRPIPEDAPLKPVNTFGSLKAAAESIARTFYLNYHTHITVVRPFHYTGPGQSEDFFFASVAKQIANWDYESDGDAYKLPDMDYQRDLLHVMDVVEAYAYLLEEGRPNESYNICAGQSWTVRDIVTKLAHAAGKNINFVDSQPHDDDGAVRWYCGSYEKMSNEFGWQPRFSIEQAAAELVESFQPLPAPSRT